MPTDDLNNIAIIYESNIIPEGILSRAGARIAGIGSAAGQYAKNVGRAIAGKETMGSGAAYSAGKLDYIIKSASKNLITDLQKLGLMPPGQVRQSTMQKVQGMLGELIQSGELTEKETPENGDTVMYGDKTYMWSGTGWATYNPETKKVSKYAPKPLQQKITFTWQRS